MNSIYSVSGRYPDCEIRIFAKGKRGYPVEFTLNHERQFERGILNLPVPSYQVGLSLEDYGRQLAAWFFADDQVKSAWSEIRGLAPARRIRLRIDNQAPELHALPWELLQELGTGDERPFLSASKSTPFSRYLSGRWQPGSPVLKRPIKILVGIANPANLGDFELEAVSVEDEWQLLHQALEGLEVELELLPGPCTLASIEAEVKRGLHVLHIIGHGKFHTKKERAVLYLADDNNQVDLVSEVQFAAMLQRQYSDAKLQGGDWLRLVFLTSCQTATRSSSETFRGFAPHLISAGVPAVLAMQDLISVDSAQQFTQVFYKELLETGQVDLAGNQARAALLTEQRSDAVVPVTFMRLRNGRLLGHRGQILGDRTSSFWNTLLENIADGECTPFLGPGVNIDLLPGPEELAQTLAQDYHYPFDNPENLARVSQFIGTIDNRRLRRDTVRALARGFRRRMGVSEDEVGQKMGLSETIAAADWSQRARELFESEIHHQLADLDLPCYITTNFDNFMTLALESKGYNPRRITIPWRDPSPTGEGLAYYDLDPEPASDVPVVVHLFGTDENLLSMVLTEDDYLDYLTRISRDSEYLLPTNVNSALASSTLLFLGYRLEDLDLKVILRGLLTNLDLARWGMLHVAVQIEAEIVDRAHHQEVVRYFQSYFSNLQIDVYWGSTHQFVADLHSRWREYQRV